MHREFNPYTTDYNQFIIQVRIFKIYAWNLNGHMIASQQLISLIVIQPKVVGNELCGLLDVGASSHIPAVRLSYTQPHTGTTYFVMMQR